MLWEELQTHPLVFLSAKMEVLAAVGPGMPLMNLQEEEAFPVAVEGDMPEKVKLMAKTGYDPTHMIEVIDILESSASSSQPIEFLSTHPRPLNRRRYIENIILENFPDGTPDQLR